MLQRCVLVLAVAFAIACGGSSTNQDGGSNSPSAIDPATAASLAASLGQASTVSGLPPLSALAAKAAALAVAAGPTVSDVTITASLAGTPARAALTSGSAKAFGFQLQVLHAPGSTAPQTFSGVLLFQGGSDWVLVAGPPSGSPFPGAVGLIGTGGQVWQATAGQESAQLQTQGSACTGTVPTIVTSCNDATFGSAGFTITSSGPVSSGATGSKTASLPAGALASGVMLTVDCSLGTGCSVPVGNSTCTYNHTQSWSAALSGDVNLSFVEAPTFLVFNYDPTTNDTLLELQAGSISNSSNPDAGLLDFTAQVEFPGKPATGLVALGTTPVPSQMTVILTDPGHTTYFSRATAAGGQMSFDITSIDAQGALPDGGTANFYCGHGHLWALVPDLTAPSRVITVDAGF